MPEKRPGPWWPATALLAAGGLLALLAGFGGLAAVLAVPAQAAFALALLHWRQPGPPLLPDWRGPLQLLGLWAASALLFALSMAWPLSTLLETGTLGAALACSLMAGLGLLAAWRAWPLWQGVERDGGGIDRHWRGLANQDVTGWRGLGAGAIVLVLAALPLLLGWNGLLPDAARWGIAFAGALLSPLLHWQLQRIAPAPVLPIPVYGFDGEDDDAEAMESGQLFPEDAGDPVAAL